MPIKTIVSDPPKKPVAKTDWKKVKYPCIGIAEDEEAVLFYEYACGVVIKAGKQHLGNRTGTHYEIWLMNRFTPAPSTKQFILSNV